MLEVLWRADNTQDDTRYKVLFPITTPLMPGHPHVQDRKTNFLVLFKIRFAEKVQTGHSFSDTLPEDRVFSVHLGTFLHDVELRNITFSTGVLTVEECSTRGFTVQEHSFPNGSKTFSLQVPFDADVVLKHVWTDSICKMVHCSWGVFSYIYLFFLNQQNPEPLVTEYFLPLIFGFLILPEETPFAHPVDVQASLQDVGEITWFGSLLLTISCSQ